jgi:hypothetical protein
MKDGAHRSDAPDQNMDDTDNTNKGKLSRRGRRNQYARRVCSPDV